MRELFQHDRVRSSVEIGPHELLVDVFGSGAPPLTPPGCKLPVQGGTAFEGLASTAGFQAAASLEDFRGRLDMFSEGALRHLDWSNLLLAGGSVLACLTKGDGESSSVANTREHFRRGAYSEADLDLFVCGLDEERALEKCKEVFAAVQRGVCRGALLPKQERGHHSGPVPVQARPDRPAAVSEPRGVPPRLRRGQLHLGLRQGARLGVVACHPRHCVPHKLGGHVATVAKLRVQAR